MPRKIDNRLFKKRRSLRPPFKSNSAVENRRSLKATRAIQPNRVFLLSPAYAGGDRARMIMSERAQFDLARRLR
jgi:hypothetical protein